MIIVRLLSYRIVWTVVAFIGAACAPPKPACDGSCEQQQSYEAERERLVQEHAETQRQLEGQEEQARQDLERSRQRLAEAQSQRAEAENSALQQVNAARIKLNLPAISHWSSEPGGLTPDGAPLIFGGKDHKVYLGCLCDAMEPDSVMSTTGEFGSNGYKSESIWSQYSDYGSSYGDFSPCSRFASHPPVVVSKEGQFYGYLTIDRFKDKAITVQAVLDWLDGICSR